MIISQIYEKTVKLSETIEERWSFWEVKLFDTDWGLEAMWKGMLGP